MVTFSLSTILLEIMKEDDLRKSLAFRYNTNWTSVNYGAYFNHQRYEKIMKSFRGPTFDALDVEHVVSYYFVFTRDSK
jgi:hypothetical protein